MNKPLPTLTVGDAVVLVLSNGNQQSAIVTGFTLVNQSHRYAHFAWKTGPEDFDSLSLHSCKWADRVLAVFPKDCKFLAV